MKSTIRTHDPWLPTAPYANQPYEEQQTAQAHPVPPQATLHQPIVVQAVAVEAAPGPLAPLSSGNRAASEPRSKITTTSHTAAAQETSEALGLAPNSGTQRQTSAAAAAVVRINRLRQRPRGPTEAELACYLYLKVVICLTLLGLVAYYLYMRYPDQALWVVILILAIFFCFMRCVRAD